ncbi:pitrilysin family protein [Ravibacter arvi]|uniref:Pitrilysin family protein n=1 Tax=Ravibacter arvi TaxID=2051041 RepID=A0ABP8LN40_9BACT
MNVRFSFSKKATLTSFLAIIALAGSFAQNLPKGITKVTSVEGITEYKLENGLRVLLFPDPSKPTITVNITYLVGSRHEGYGEAGMAHLLEHMVFKGTPKHPNIMQELTEHGARPNGTTWYDRTNYYETFSATENNLKWALDLEADRMINSYIAKKDLESEFSVVRNEFEAGENSPFRVLMQRVADMAYSWHNYGKSTIGNRSDIERVPIENLQAFYKKYYQPDNAVLMVAGQIDEAKTLGLVSQYFGVIPKPERVLPQTYTTEPIQDGERFVEVKRVGDVQMVMAAYHIAPGAHSDYAPTEVLAELLTAEPYGKLYKNLVGTQKASSQFGLSFQLYDPGYALFGVELLKEKSLDEAKNAFLATLDSVANATPSAEDIERAKTTILKNWDLQFRNAERVGTGISEFIAFGDWRLAFLYRDQIRKVTADDVMRVAKTYFKPSNRTVGVFIPEASPSRTEVPARPDIAALLKDYKGEAQVSQGEAFDPSPANIEKRTTKVSNPGGLELALLPKKTMGNVVSAQMTFRFGDEQSLQNKGAIPSFTADLLNKGTTSRTRQQIKDELDKLKAAVSVGGGANQVVVSIETVKESLPGVIKVVADILKNPSFEESELEKLRQEQIAGIESQRGEPQAIAVTEFRRKTSPYKKGDPRYVGSFDEDLEDVKKVTVAEVKQFYKDFYGASNATIAIVGDFDKEPVEKLLTDAFGNWKSPKTFKRLVSRFEAPKASNESIETPDKANAMFMAGLPIAIQDNDPDYPAMVLGNFILGGGVLNSRLASRIRVKDGLSYGVGSQFSASPLDKSGNFLAYAIYAPQNVTKLEQAFKEEIERALKGGFTEEEVSSAKTGYLQSRQVSRAQDNALSNTLSNNLYLKRTLAWDEDFEKKVQALTPAQIKAAVNKFIDLNKMVIVKAGEFSKSPSAAPAGSPAAVGSQEKN